MSEAARCCGWMPEILWTGAPALYRVACRVCGMTTARQASEADAIALWNDYRLGRRSMQRAE